MAQHTHVGAILRNRRKEWVIVKSLSALAFTLPGGTVEDGETLDDTLRRGLREKLLLMNDIEAEKVYQAPYESRHDGAPHLWVVFEVVPQGY